MPFIKIMGCLMDTSRIISIQIKHQPTHADGKPHGYPLMRIYLRGVESPWISHIPMAARTMRLTNGQRYSAIPPGQPITAWISNWWTAT